MADAERSIDSVLDRLETITARLARAEEPIEELVLAYEEGVHLLSEAEARLEGLAEKAAAPA